MRHVVFLLSLLLLGLALSVSAEPAAPIDRLIAQLGSGEFAEREKAMESLAAIGGIALDALRKAAASDDLEIRRRAEELIRRIERQEESARLLAGKRIRLSFQDSPVETALAELNRLTGFAWRINPADLPGLASSRITLRTDTVPVWEAFDRFCAKAGLVVPDRHSPAARTASLVPGVAPVVPTCYSGAVRIRARSEPAQGWGRTVGVYEVSIPLEVVTEPNLQWHGVADVLIRRAVDDQGQELEQIVADREGPGSDPLEQELLWARQRAIIRKQALLDLSDMGHGKQVQVRLKLGTEKARLIQEMQGTLIGQMDTPPESQAEISDILHASGRTAHGKDGSVLKIGEVKHDDSDVVQIAVEFQSAPFELGGMPLPINNRRVAQMRLMMFRAEAAGGTLAAPQFELRDTEGRLFEIARYNESNQINGDKSEYSATLHALPSKGVGAPARLVLTGRRTLTVEVPFTLKDIPLP